MTTIRLGVGADAIEVEEGPVTIFKIEEPIRTTSSGRLFELDGIALLQVATTICNVKRSDGTTAIPGWWQVDLDALRRERALKVETVGGWTLEFPREGQHGARWLCHRSCGPHGVDGKFWTHRPSNTPEKQAAFDAALEAWLSRYYSKDAFIPGSSSVPEVQALIDAARALAYGEKR